MHRVCSAGVGNPNDEDDSRIDILLYILFYIRTKQFNRFDGSLEYYNALRCFVGLQNEGHGNKDAGPVLWSPFEILNGRIIDSDVKPTYRIIGTDVTSYKTVYNYSCTLYGLYGRYMKLPLQLQQDAQKRHRYLLKQ